MPAGHFSSICGTLIHSQDVDGEDRTFIEPEVGGWGAGAAKDGENAQFSTSHGDTFNCPVEINEARNGIAVERLALNDERTGAGRHRGGKGIDLRYRILAERAWLTAKYTRSVTPPWGIHGGGEGSCNRLQILRSNGTTQDLNGASNLPLHRGDIVRIVTANGGGFGDPSSRPASEVGKDLRDGYITAEEAREVYGFE